MADDDAFDDETDMTEAEFDRLWATGTPTAAYCGGRILIGDRVVPPTVYFDFVKGEVRF